MKRVKLISRSVKSQRNLRATYMHFFFLDFAQNLLFIFGSLMDSSVHVGALSVSNTTRLQEVSVRLASWGRQGKALTGESHAVSSRETQKCFFKFDSSAANGQTRAFQRASVLLL